VLAAQQKRGERGRKSQRVERGDGDREGDGQRELTKQNPGCAGEKRNWYEDGNQHQRSGDDGSRNFLHGVGRGFDRIQFAFLQMALDVFDDDDSVVDDQTGGERDAEQGQRVDGEAEQFDECERADERNRNGNRRDDSRAPVFEENKDDQNDQRDGSAEGRDYIANGFADGIRRIEGDLILHAGRKVFGKAIEFGDALLVDVEGVGGGELRDGDANRFPSVVVQVVGVIFGAEFGVTHVFQTDQGAVGVALEDDVVELSGFRKTADGADADLEILAGHGWLRTDLSGRDFDVLLTKSVHHVIRSEGAAGHALGIEPQAHGVFAFAEEDDVGHTGNALQAVADVNIEIVTDEES